ncbi:hypothetical protein FGG78_31305 [Thioclava sp. BHET1]|nr:hypothetical protein FGG78_31305 [Thioclava sp. BHET1]
MPSQSGGILNVAQAQAALSRSVGGGAAQGVHVSVGVTVDQGGNLQAYVDHIASTRAAQSARGVLSVLPDKIKQYQSDPRRR